MIWGSSSQIVKDRTNIDYDNGLFTVKFLEELGKQEDVNEDMLERVAADVGKAAGEQAKAKGLKDTDEMYLPQTKKYSEE